MSDSESDDSFVEPSAKRLKKGAGGEGQATAPMSFVSWNANGLVSRCSWNKDDLHRLLRETHNPDVLCLQEVRLKAAGPANRGTPLASDYASVKDVMERSVFSDYQPFWSLHDNKYAGTLTLIHKRLAFDANNSNCAFTTRSALSLLLKKYHLTRQDIGISNNNNNIPKRLDSPKKKKQTSMTAFFAPKATAATTSPNKKSSVLSDEHHSEGRFQFFSFSNFDLINTYVPNNGTKEESYQRRREWDHDMKAFLASRRKLLEKAAEASKMTNNNNKSQDNDHQDNATTTTTNIAERPLLWCGDLNVAADYRDGSHWKRGTIDNDTEDEIFEFWTDEKQCFVAGVTKRLDPNRHSDDKGIPSFTTNERRRFAEIRREADLADTWRELHPDGCSSTDDDNAKYKSPWDRPNFTWRGHLSKDGNTYASKYQGKGQRLDYFLLSPSSLVKDVVLECSILGYGEKREGLFCGSDHCATILKLKKPF